MPLDKTAIIKQAQKFAAKGQLDKAVEEWQKLIQETPNDGNIFNTIGDLQLKSGASAKAVQAYLKAADAFQNGGFELKAIAVFKKIIKIDPTRLDVCEKLADLNATRGMLSNATDEYYRVAKQYAKLGNVKAALQIYQKVADLDATNVHARLKLAETCHKEGYNDQAIEAYRKALEFYRSRNQKNDAESVLKQIRQIQPNFQEQAESKAGAPAPAAAPSAAGSPLPAAEGTQKAAAELSETPPLVGAVGSGNRIAGAPAAKAVSPAGGKGEELTSPREHPVSASAAATLADPGTSWGNIKLKAPEAEAAAPAEVEAAEPAEVQIEEESARELSKSKDESLSQPEDGPVQEASASDAGTAPETSRSEEEPVKVSPPPAGEKENTPVVAEAATEAEVSAEEPGAAQPVSSISPEEIQNRLTEAEVYLKYGLIEKARDQFLEVVKAAPDHSEAYLQLKEIYKKEGDTKKAVEICKVLANLYESRGEKDRQTEMIQERNQLLRAPAEISASGEVLIEEPRESEGAAAAEQPEDESEASSPPEKDPFAEQLEKADELLKRNRIKDARRIFIKILDDDPEHPVAREKLLQIEDKEISFRESKSQPPVKRGAPAPPVQNRPTSAPQEASFEDLLKSLDESFSDHTLETSQSDPSLPKAPIRDLAEAASKPAEGENYIDLTALLDGFDEQNRAEASAPQTEVESELDTIFEEFQRGQNDQPKQEDVETHFNLGIAYNEMGLVDDAINEYKQSMSGERYIDSALMLALCYQRKGILKESEQLLRSLMKDSRCSKEQQMLVKYELGIILSEGPQKAEAAQLFGEVHAQDPKFRDVASRVGAPARKKGSDSQESRKKRISYL